MTKQPLIILSGPTAVGKTALSVELAKRINGAIISADSMQVYKYMDIGSAKIMPEEMKGIKHYLIDELNPEDEFSIVVFQQKAKAALAEIYANGQIPIIAGGTGFYIQALLYDIDFTTSLEEEEGQLRKELEALGATKGATYLHERLRSLDEESANQIHPNNMKRVIRAIEYCETTGNKFSEHNEEQRQKESPYDFYYFVLNDERSVLYERIEKRVDMAGYDDYQKRIYGFLTERLFDVWMDRQNLRVKECELKVNGLRLNVHMWIVKRAIVRWGYIHIYMGLLHKDMRR